MPFARVQANKLLILHSKRIDGQVKQIKLHTFNTFSDAQDIVDSDSKWNLFCESLRIQFNVKINDTKLRENIRTKLKGLKFEETDSTNTAVLQVLNFLKNCKPPLSPKQILTLKRSKTNLLLLKDVIGKKMLTLEAPMESVRTDEETGAEKCLEYGLELYRQGDWDEAKRYFLNGLKSEPKHVDLLVHAGLIDFIHQNFVSALNFFDDAMMTGKKFADLMIATEPDEYIKNSDLDNWAKNKVCDLADECPDCFSEKCDDCETSPKNQKTELYRYLEFRPFFRSLTNRSLTLMKLKRFDEAINTLLLCQEYQPLWGTYNMIGVCHLSLGEIQKADEWYGEFLWGDSYYIKALIKHLLGQNEDAFRYLLPGIIKISDIANMLIGKEKVEETRYLGDALPNRLKASEFIHEQGYLFKNNPDFRNLIRCILEDDEVSALLRKLEIKRKKRKNDRNYKMDKKSWNLLYGSISDEFINQYVPKFVGRLNDKNGNYWKPTIGEILKVQIIEKKQRNWLIQQKNYEKEFYFRPPVYVDHYKDGDLIQILVSKSWYYRKRLFVSGEIEQ